MAWDKLQKAETKKEALKEEDYFVSSKKAKELPGLKIGISGPPEGGKTHFICTCPEPVRIIDTEFGATPVAKANFPDRDIRIFEAVVIDPTTDEVNPSASLDRLEQAIGSLRNIEGGTVAIDSGTDVWQRSVVAFSCFQVPSLPLGRSFCIALRPMAQCLA